MVERSLSMREVPGSIPGISKRFFSLIILLKTIMNRPGLGKKTRSSCGGVVNATDSKSVSLWERRFESYQLRSIFSITQTLPHLFGGTASSLHTKVMRLL